jgi:gamma-glutamylcyclotransferase (GGCT)/AIG2-like uncharacterized protein YtfP
MPASDQRPITNLLFVYGTLMQAFDNPYARQLRTESWFVGPGHLPGILYRVSWFPGAVPDSSARSLIHGEVYKLKNPEEMLLVLDDYEDVGDNETGLYVRRQLPVQVGDRALNCWLYVYNESTDGLMVVEEGKFAE